MSRGERKAMITRDAPELSLSRQCRLLSIGRSSFYYAPRGESPSSLALMRRIDELFMKYPFYGSRQMVRQLRRDGVCVGRHRVRRLMRLIGLEAIYQAPRTSVPHPMHRIYPYLLKGDGYRPAQSGLVRRHHLYPRPAWLSVPGSDHGLGDAPRFILAAVEHHGRWILRRGLWATRWPATASRRYSIRIRAASSPASTSPACSRTRASASPWTVGAAAWTTSSSSACGGLSYEAVYLHELTDGFHAERVIGEWIGFYNTELAPFVPRRSNAGRGLRGRSTCGYDGQGSRLAHIPTGSTTATGCDKKDFGSMIKQRNTP